MSPSVVVIDVTGRESNGDGSAVVSRSTGTGVIWTESGDVLTAAHVLDGALALSVRLLDGRRFSARVVGRDLSTDLALLHVDASGLQPAERGQSLSLSQGDWLVAIGAPYGLSYSVTAGVLSAKGRGGIGANLIEDYLQTDAALNPGNSGGPLCDLKGRVVGINAMVVADTRGIGFAVPVEMAVEVAKQLAARGHVSRPWLGVDYQDLTPDLARAMGAEPYSGVLLGGVNAAGPGMQAKLSPGDIVTRLGSASLHLGHDLARALSPLHPGQQVSLEVWRKGVRYQTQMVLGERPDGPPAPLPMESAPRASGLGLTVRAADKSVRNERSTRVASVVLGSAADRAALRKDDRILNADGQENPTVSDIARLSADGTLLLQVSRGARTFWAALHN